MHHNGLYFVANRPNYFPCPPMHPFSFQRKSAIVNRHLWRPWRRSSRGRAYTALREPHLLLLYLHDGPRSIHRIRFSLDTIDFVFSVLIGTARMAWEFRPAPKHTCVSVALIASTHCFPGPSQLARTSHDHIGTDVPRYSRQSRLLTR